jgi:hypothetical protein
MHRRRFLKNILGVVATALLPVTSLSYDPVKRAVITPPADVSPLIGYSGDTFMEEGYVYAPYMPLVLSNKEYDKYFEKKTLI